jgi:hypothetical protein
LFICNVKVHTTSRVGGKESYDPHKFAKNGSIPLPATKGVEILPKLCQKTKVVAILHTDLRLGSSPNSDTKDSYSNFNL